MKAESVHAALLLFVVAGLGLSVFATLETYIPALQNVCSVSPFFSCSAVDRSNHTTTLGVPDWAIGVAGFVVLLVLDIPLYLTWRRDLLQAVVVVSGLGLAASAYFAYVELAIIHAVCPVCFSTYVADAVVFLLSLWGFRSSRPTDDGEEPERSESTPSPSPQP
ncbi:MAG: vitamin K epoxide reductase family protein [Candidatus Lutacidiplasmatales archaeon]